MCPSRSGSAIAEERGDDRVWTGERRTWRRGLATALILGAATPSRRGKGIAQMEIEKGGRARKPLASVDAGSGVPRAQVSRQATLRAREAEERRAKSEERGAREGWGEDCGDRAEIVRSVSAWTAPPCCVGVQFAGRFRVMTGKCCAFIQRAQDWIGRREQLSAEHSPDASGQGTR